MTTQLSPTDTAGGSPRTPSLTAAEAAQIADALATSAAAGATDRDLTRTHPIGLLTELAGTGLLGVTVPRSAGGSGLPLSVSADVLRRLARGDANLAQLVLSHFVLLDIASLAAEPDTLALLHEVATGSGWLGNATAERGTAHVFDRRTSLTRRPDGTGVLSGRKFYATGALGSTLFGVAANLDGDPGHPVIAFVSPSDAGVAIDGDWTAFGQRTTASGSVHLIDVLVPWERVIDLGELPVDPPRSPVGAYDQLLHAAIDVGIARAALEDGAAFVRERARPWVEADVERVADEQLVQHRFGRLRALVAALEALFARAGAAVDAVRTVPAPTEEALIEASLAVAEVKALAQEVGPEVATEVIELGGTSSADERHGLDRHWRNVRVHSLHDPARWKYVHLGRHLLDGTAPPKHPLL
ncbi:acyl-CoA dehydrogenase family protein [Nocardioides sp. CER19]|uniref:acyl-CoA dehydrogenase family protein n=1 Tax=Nocardioides sp. CER19 TaxID=3038538 RepID=UPI00244A9A1D|nr:acyl-CoA dehydrogenase family protein [Nocardioides sp. CER19]MDH2413178.1 acyl-CoA dehydrogenase family protein [Nocardioides sp. CER19]